jgi:hypothetical protein
MALALGSKTLDSGLGYISSNADKIYICSIQPTTYTEATTSYALGSANFGVGAVAGAPQAGTGGRKIVINAVTSSLGTISGVSTVASWAIVDSVNSLLLATGPLTGGTASVMGQAWTLDAFEITQTNAFLTHVYDSATTAWAAAVVSGGGAVLNARKNLVDDMIVGLKSDGVWSKLDRLWLLAGADSQSANTDLVVRDSNVTLAGTTLYPDLGYSTFTRGGATVTFAGYNLVSNAVNFSQDSAHASFWNLAYYEDNDASLFGTVDGSMSLYGRLYFNNGAYCRINETTSGLAATVLDGRGFYVGNRSGAAAEQLYKDGVLLGSTNVSSNAVVSQFIRTDRGFMTAISAGGSLTSTEQLALYNRVRTYMQSVFGATNAEVMSWMAGAAYIGGGGGAVASSTRRTLVDTLVNNLKTDGVWSKLDRLWLFAAENSSSALIDIKAATSAAVFNSPTFTPDRGYDKASNTSAYIDTNFNPSTVGNTNFAQDSACVFAWSNTSGADGGPLVSGSGSTSTRLFPQYTDNLAYYNVNNSGVDGTQSGLGDGIGLWAVNRTNATDTQLYRNGSSVASMTTATSGAVVSQNLWALREGSLYSSRQICCLGAGASLNSTEQLALYNRLRTYMTAVGVP